MRASGRADLGNFLHRADLFAAIMAVGLLLFSIPAMAQSPSQTQTQTGEFDSVRSAADSARSQGDAAQAIQLYARAEELNPAWPDGWWFLGTLQYGADRYAEARDSLTHYVALTPNAGPALALRGLCEFELGQYPESLSDLQRGIALGAANQPRNTQILLYHEALLLTLLGKFEEALGKYIYFANQNPAAANPELATAVGLAGLRMALLPADADPAQAELIAMTGRAAIAAMGRDPHAAEAFQQLFARYPQAPNVHYVYGYLLFATDPVQASRQFQQELAVAPDSAPAHAMMAWAAGLRGDYAAALPDAKKAAAEDPSLAMGQLVCGRSLVETGDIQGGLPYLENVLRMEPANLEAHLTLVKAYSELGRSEDARRERLLCLALSDPDSGRGAHPVANP